MSIFFKYCRLNDYTRDLIRTNRFYFAHPTEFNDPFDSKVPLSMQMSTDEFRELARALIGRRRSAIPPDVQHCLVEDMIASGFSKELTSEENARRYIDILL